IAMAFFISRGFVKTGLGRRIALHFVKLFGKKTLGLAYSIVGVLYMTLKIGEFPIVSIILALSFGTYGLLKKVVHIDAISSIT
ncbi:anion permease, partial [Staphylococcus aureus]|nr:anion permease [Staphylococcus aureus]